MDYKDPYPANHLGTAGPTSFRLVSGISCPGKPGRWGVGLRGGNWLSLSLSLPPQINFLIFMRILGILASKLRTQQMRCPDYRLR